MMKATGSNITATVSADSLTFSPQLELQTGYVLNADGRIASMGAPDLSPGPLFSLVRSNKQCAWAVNADVPDNIAREIEALAREEPPVQDFEAAPVHAQKYLSLLEGRGKISVEGGPAFIFPDVLPVSSSVVTINDVKQLQKNLNGWNDIEGWTPVIAVVEEGQFVQKVCCRSTAQAGPTVNPAPLRESSG